jgi:hypothetical protein
MTSHPDNSNEEKNFGEFRRMVKSAEVLSGSMERLLMSLQFRGRVSVVMQNGRVLKSGYEESYFHSIRGTVRAETRRGRRSCKTDSVGQSVRLDDAPSSFWDEVRTIQGNQVPAMMQEKAKVKIRQDEDKEGKGGARDNGQKELNPVEVRKDIAHMVNRMQP